MACCIENAAVIRNKNFLSRSYYEGMTYCTAKIATTRQKVPCAIFYQLLSDGHQKQSSACPPGTVTQSKQKTPHAALYKGLKQLRQESGGIFQQLIPIVRAKETRLLQPCYPTSNSTDGICEASQNDRERRMFLPWVIILGPENPSNFV